MGPTSQTKKKKKKNSTAAHTDKERVAICHSIEKLGESVWDPELVALVKPDPTGVLGSVS